MGLLDGEIAIVTGGARGIGRGISNVLAGEGASVLVVDLDGGAAESAAGEIARTPGGPAIGMAAEIGSEPDSVLVAERCVREFGTPTILVNNAGVYLQSPLLEMSLAQWERVFRVNVTGTFLMTRAVGALMTRARRGKIINISSCSARKPDLGQAAYNASKSAIVGLTRVTALELGPHGVYCNAVLPGATDTEMTRSTFLTSPDVEREWRAKSPLGRLGTPEDIARAVLFLSSYLSDHITGESLVVAAGEMMTQ